MQDNIFEKARLCISEGLIRSYFDCEKSKVRSGRTGRELMTLCPFRNDTKPGSFFVNLDNGMWIEKSSCSPENEGDFIKLVSLAYNLDLKAAAEKIVNDSGGILPEPKKDKKEIKKAAPMIPIPDEKLLEKLNDHITSKFIVEKWGPAVRGWRYRNKDGKIWMCVVRHEKDNEKEMIPYYFGNDQKWHAGMPLKKDRPLYGIDRIENAVKEGKKYLKILIVEGEKCADIEVDGWTLITWSGGTGQIKHSDWQTLRKYKKYVKEFLFWPDYDQATDNETLEILPDEKQAGLSAALYVQSILPFIDILDVYTDSNHQPKWDIADAAEEKINLNKFINDGNYYTIEKKEKETENYLENFFKFMGFDEGRHYFLPTGSNIIKSIKFGGMTKNKLLELAPLSAWAISFPAKKSSFFIDAATDFMIRESEKKGFFKPDSVRGAGIWLDNDNIIINDGNNVCDDKGYIIENMKSKYFYVKSDKNMGDFSGKCATEEEGKKLVNLFMSQGFETELQAFIALGWSLIAPFGGILKWRPHIWITGPRGSGKTYTLENLIKPICGPFAYVGSGKDSEAGLYRTLWRDPCPVIKDEMEPGGNKETRMKIEQTLEVARNASSDFSAYKTIANMSGGVDRFCIRSCFCFSSIVPYLPGDAIESRIMISRLKNLSFVKKKIENTKEIFKTGLMDDPGIFRRKIYKCLPTILKNIELLRTLLMQQIGDAREADNLAPIFAAVFALMLGDEKINIDKAAAFMEDMISSNIKNEDGNDEDKLLNEIFDYSIRVGTESISVAELIIMFDRSETEAISDDYLNALLRMGIKIHSTKEGVRCLAIARSHTSIKRILSDSIYSGRYTEVLKRHEATIEACKSVRFASQVKGAVLLDWDKIKKMYFSYDDHDQLDLFDNIL